MSAAIRRIIPLAFCSLLLSLLAVPVAAQSRDPLPDVRERLKIEAQRVEKEIHDGRMQAYRVLRSDPEGAFDIIKGLIATLRKDTALSEARREDLRKALQRDIASLRALANVRRTTDPLPRAVNNDLRRAPDPRASQDKRSATDAAEARFREMKGRIADVRTQRQRTGDRYSATLDGVQKSSTLPASDYDLPPDWLEKTKKRSALAKLTAQEKAILEALKKPVKVDYNMDTFQSVIDHLSKQMGQNILLDKHSMEEANVTYDTPITLRFDRPVSARTALKRVLADVGMTYVVRNQSIEVTTLARAKEMMTTRTYYVGDLMGVASPLLPAIVNQYQAMQAIGSIISQIQGIDPESWEARGGPGTIAFDPVRMSLVIRQSAEFHYMINGGQ
jgi:hypothetical protein